MNSRERVLLSIAHKPIDRVAMDYQAHGAVTDALIKKLGVVDQEELLQSLHVDMRRVFFNHRLADSPVDSEGYVRSMWGSRYRSIDTNNPIPEWRRAALNATSSDGLPCYISPFGESTTIDDIHAHQWPDAALLDYSHVRSECEKHYGKYAIYGGPWSPFFHEIGWLIGEENFLMWMIEKPDIIKAILQHIVDFEVEALRRFLDAAGGMIDITYFGNDFGTQRGLYISPEHWEEFIRPQVKRFIDVSHEYHCKAMMHSCGGIRSIIPSLIEDGLDILDPIQVAAEGMSLSGLVEDFGGRICFHGGVDTQHTLPHGAADDVRKEVKSYISMTRKKGYIICGSQEFIEDIPLDNILALYDEASRAVYH
jgi:uroporphyrinogen decarboxylase